MGIIKPIDVSDVEELIGEVEDRVSSKDKNIDIPQLRQRLNRCGADLDALARTIVNTLNSGDERLRLKAAQVILRIHEIETERLHTNNIKLDTFNGPTLVFENADQKQVETMFNPHKEREEANVQQSYK